MTVVPLADLLADPALTHDVMLAGIDEAFAGTGAEDVFGLLDDAARPLFEVARLGLRAQAAALGTVITDRLELRVVSDDHRGLLLGHALASRQAHPMLLAALGHEIARRAGVPSLVACGKADFWTVLQSDTCYLPIAYRSPARPVTGGIELRRVCAHELAGVILNTLAAHAAPPDAARAEEILRLALPRARDHSH